MSDLLEMSKEYLRIDGDHDNEMIGLLIDSAHEYLQNAGVNRDEESKQYQLAVMMLVTHWYENRNQEIEGRTSRTMGMALQAIILQLKAGASSE